MAMIMSMCIIIPIIETDERDMDDDTDDNSMAVSTLYPRKFIVIHSNMTGDVHELSDFSWFFARFWP